MTFADWSIICPACRVKLGALAEHDQQVVCPGCGTTYGCLDGIWRFLPPSRADYFAPFLRDYAAIRQAEGRGIGEAARCRALPECPPNDPLAWQWRMRAQSFASLRRHVLKQRTRLRVLDLGAGVGWLSHRLMLLGQYSVSVDITVDRSDGLGATRHYAPDWPRFQAEFDRLPLADGQADVAIYNASLHYSADYCKTLAEALRVLRPGGQIVVMDSPIYSDDASGQQMIAERQAAFERSYGTRSDAVPSVGYLTWAMLRKLTKELELRWQVVRPWYGWRWAVRPLRARLNGRREPSTFALLVARSPSPPRHQGTEM